jgi:phage terminase large subunit
MKLNRAVVQDVVAGVDWGFTNPGVILVFAVDNDGRLYLIREHYHTQKTIDWWIDRAKSAVRDFGVSKFICDPAEPGFISQFKSAQLRAVKGYNEILPGIEAVQQRLAPAQDGRPRLYLRRDAIVERDSDLMDAAKPTCTAEEIVSYVWGTPKTGRAADEKPVDEFNHGLDALRYTVAEFDLAQKRGMWST